MRPDEMKAAYERLAMLHAETMAELIATQKRMDAMSNSWWWMFKHWVQKKIGMKSRWEE